MEINIKDNSNMVRSTEEAPKTSLMAIPISVSGKTIKCMVEVFTMTPTNKYILKMILNMIYVLLKNR